jgi:tripartite-type tricarboxylate transporter receptor subunit TctC
MQISRRQAMAIAALALSPIVRAQPAATEPFPSKPVRLVVPFPPGGPTDALARQMGEALSARWRQPVVVENKPGGNTILGTEVIARSAPDGRTLGVVTGSHIINPLLSAKMPYDTLRDLTGVMLLTRFHMAVYAHPSFSASNPAELLALAREPDRVSYAYATTQTFLAMELLNSMAGTRMRNVPYKGSAQAFTDLLGGHVQLLVDPLTQGGIEHVRNGKLKLIGTMGAQRPEAAPDAPIIASAVPGYDFSGAFGLVVRGGTPSALVRQIRDDVAAVLAQPALVTRMRDIGQEPIVSTPDQYNTYIQSEMSKWRPIVVKTGAKID